jgi:glycosyltransferase involved in cell wall biosynthesis
MVSVLMTSYNRESFIAESIDSVLAQTFLDYELIIVDDNSTDQTRDIILSYSGNSKIKIIFNEYNLGEYKNRNKAASFANRKYIKYLDSDDVMAVDCLELMVSKMEKHPSAAIGLMSYFNDKINEFCEPLKPRELYNQFYFKGDLINCGPSSTIIRRDIFEKLGGYNLEPYISDTDFIFRICAKHNAVVFPKKLILWREHPNQEFAYAQKINYFEKNIFSYFLNYLESNSNPMDFVDKTIALRNLKNRYSRKILLKLIKLDFGNVKAGFKMYRLNYFDVLLSLFPNRYPKL